MNERMHSCTAVLTQKGNQRHVQIQRRRLVRRTSTVQFFRMANKSYRKCLYKGNCDLNCQVFVCDDENQTCVACKHHSAFHEQLQPADTSKLKQTSYDGGSAGTSLLQSIPSTSGLNLQQQTQGKLKTLEEWKASKTKKSFDYRTKGSRKKNENLDQEVSTLIA